MKNSITLLLACCFLFLTAAQAQLSTPAWSQKFEQTKAFIENKGQFNVRSNRISSPILYAVDNGAIQIYFSINGVSYIFNKKEKNLNRRDGDKSQPKIFFESDAVNMTWAGSNPNATLIAEQSTEDYYSYAMKNGNEMIDIHKVKGFKKLVYKNLYQNIDIEYIFHPQDGIKYSLILHPGADISQVKMVYDINEILTLRDNGDIFIDTKFGDVVEHAPQTFYTDSKTSISSSFIRNGNSVSFELGNYDHSKTIVIDPWVQTPVFSYSNCVWECEKDANGNVYVIGGDAPLKLRKYDSGGNTSWTYNTPYDTTDTDWLGALATDLAGNSYVTNGASAAMQKINTSGSLVWSVTGGAFDEYWSIAFNCDQTKMIVGGTRLETGGISLIPHAYIYNINTSNGAVNNNIRVGYDHEYSLFGFISNQGEEVRTITSARNARYYFLNFDTIGSVHENLAAVLSGTDHTIPLSYKCEDYRPTPSTGDGSFAGNGGICAIKADEDFVYTNFGNVIHKRSLTTGAIIASASIPGGISNASANITPTQYSMGSSGIDIDDCGNIYVGSGNAVIKYDANLNLITSASTSYHVYDVVVSTNGNIIACGATGTYSSSSRTGYVQSFAMSACVPIVLECCDANIYPESQLCTTDPSITLSAVTNSGTWSGPGISGNGIFNPSVAGAGIHTITNTIGCGSSSIEIEVVVCAELDICLENNGALTANNGTGPYTWEHTTQIQDCSLCFLGCDFPPGCATTTTGYAAFGGTGATTTTAPTGYPVRVTDNVGNTLIINNSGSLSSCSSSCSLTLSTSTIPATCGNANGGASVTPTGTGPYTYSWSPGGATTSSITNIAGGNYTVTVTSQGGACTETASVTVAESGGITLSTSSTQATCGNTNGGASVSITAGTGPFTYLWSPGGATTSSISSVAAGDYTVTVSGANSCSSTTTITVASTNAITLSNNSTNTTCGNNNGTVSTNITAGTGPYTYAWSPGGATTASVSNLAAGDYTVTVTGAGGCTATGTVTVGASTSLSVTPSATAASCNQSNGSASVVVTGGSGTYTYLWSNQATTSSISGVATGNYDVTINDGQGCTETETILVPQNTSLTGSATTTEVSCGQANSGAIDLSVSGGTPGFTYSWSPGGATTQDLSGIAAGDYTVTVTDAGGCQFISTYTVDSENTMVVASNVEHETCKGYHDGSIDLTVTGSNGPFTYLWTPGNATTQDLSGLQGGNYSVVVTDQSTGCSDTQTFNVQAGYNFPVSITQSGDTLTATLAPNYTWYLNGVEIPGATTQSIVITEGGNYHVVVGSQNCEFESNHTETSCICSNSIEDNSLFHGISVYPNPANEELNVVITLTSVEQASVTLIDLTGRRLWLKKENDKADNFAWKIPVGDIAAGNYFVQINVDGQTKSVKVLVKD